GERAAHQDVERDRETDREARDRLERPARIGGAREDDPDEEEGQDALDHDALPDADAARKAWRAEVRRGPQAVGEEPAQQQRGGRRAEELDAPVDERERRRQPARDEEAERDSRV